MQGMLLGLVWAGSASLAPMPPALTPAVPVAATSPAADWQYTGAAAQCELLSDGDVHANSGAEVSFKCAADAGVFGNLQLQLPTAGLQQRRVTVTAEIRAGDDTSASLWIKTQHGGQPVMFEDDTELQWLDGAAPNQWVSRQLSIAVTGPADRLTLGVRVQGGGDVALRNVRLQVSAPGVMAAGAEQWLESALRFIKARTLARGDLSWRVLEPQARILAAGAQSPAEVYPAIRYLLSQLGGQSLLLAPPLAYLFQGSSSGSDANGLTLTLPDGARLILASEAVRSVTAAVQYQSSPRH